MKLATILVSAALLFSLTLPVGALAVQNSGRDGEEGVLYGDKAVARDINDKVIPITGGRLTRPEPAAAVTVKQGELAKAYLERLIKRLGAAVERLERLLTRIDSRLTKLEAEGLDMSAARAKQKEAESALAQARAALANLRPAEITGALETSSLREAIAGFHNQVRELIALIRQAHAKLVEVIKETKKGLAKQSGTPTDDEEPAVN